MKIYIAGKITGDDAYKEKFSAAAAALEREGHTVLNPAVLPEGMEPADYMRICLAMIDIADEVVFLPDTVKSTGAVLEHQYCSYIGKPISWRNGEFGRNREPLAEQVHSECGLCDTGRRICGICAGRFEPTDSDRSCSCCFGASNYSPVSYCPKCGRKLR